MTICSTPRLTIFSPARYGLMRQEAFGRFFSYYTASQDTHCVDPSAPTVCGAVFWVYVRQCLYNATISQQPLDIDFSLQLHPTPDSLQDSHPLVWLRVETAWANQILWYTACVANFCFAGPGTQSEPASSNSQWQELRELVQTWHSNRPSSFDPIWLDQSQDGCVFSPIWFTADWHGKRKLNIPISPTHGKCSDLIRVLSLPVYPNSRI
jgi:hypothetical protein